MKKKLTHLLTNQEIILIKLICDEYTSKEIAVLLNVCTSTVGRQRKQLMMKTGTKKVAGIVNYAVRNGIITI
jgi:DNA-binding CsgD family transcriptional regulator